MNTLSLVLTLLLGGPDDDGWRLHEENPEPGVGYVIYRRPVSGSDLFEYKLLCLFAAPSDRVVEAVRTMALSPRHVSPKNARRTILQKRSHNEFIIHNHFKLSFVNDRDATTRLTLSYDAATLTHTWLWETANEQGPPPQEGVVRIPKSRSSWALSPAENGQTMGVYRSLSDPGGLIPDWLTNSLVTDSMTEQLAHIRQIIVATKPPPPAVPSPSAPSLPAN